MLEQIHKILSDKLNGKIEIKQQDNIIYGCITRKTYPIILQSKKRFLLST